MICLRCGYCCTNYSVIIVDDPELGLTETNLTHHPGDGPCQHLLGEDIGQYSCRLHSFSWYPETPCAAHGQIEQSSDDFCRMGMYVFEKNGIPIPTKAELQHGL